MIYLIVMLGKTPSEVFRRLDETYMSLRNGDKYPSDLETLEIILNDSDEERSMIAIQRWVGCKSVSAAMLRSTGRLFPDKIRNKICDLTRGETLYYVIETFRNGKMNTFLAKRDSEGENIKLDANHRDKNGVFTLGGNSENILRQRREKAVSGLFGLCERLDALDRSDGTIQIHTTKLS